MIVYMEANAEDCFSAAVKVSPFIPPKPKPNVTTEMKAHIIGCYDAANMMTKADLLRGTITGNFLGEFRRISIIAIAEHGPFTNNQLDDLFAKIAVGLVFSGHFDLDHSPEAIMARRAELAGRITNKMLIASEINKPGRIHEIAFDATIDSPDGPSALQSEPQSKDLDIENQVSARVYAQANDKNKGGTGWPRNF